MNNKVIEVETRYLDAVFQYISSTIVVFNSDLSTLKRVPQPAGNINHHRSHFYRINDNSLNVMLTGGVEVAMKFKEILKLKIPELERRVIYLLITHALLILTYCSLFIYMIANSSIPGVNIMSFFAVLRKDELDMLADNCLKFTKEYIQDFYLDEGLESESELEDSELEVESEYLNENQNGRLSLDQDREADALSKDLDESPHSPKDDKNRSILNDNSGYHQVSKQENQSPKGFEDFDDDLISHRFNNQRPNPRQNKEEGRKSVKLSQRGKGFSQQFEKYNTQAFGNNMGKRVNKRKQAKAGRRKNGSSRTRIIGMKSSKRDPMSGQLESIPERVPSSKRSLSHSKRSVRKATMYSKTSRDRNRKSFTDFDKISRKQSLDDLDEEGIRKIEDKIHRMSEGSTNIFCCFIIGMITSLGLAIGMLAGFYVIDNLFYGSAELMANHVKILGEASINSKACFNLIYEMLSVETMDEYNHCKLFSFKL